MKPLDPARWLSEVDAFVKQFLIERAPWLDQYNDALEPSSPWVEPDRPNMALDVVYRSGIMPPTQRTADDGWDHITVLRARGRRLAKRIADDGSIEDYDSAKYFDLVEVPADAIDALEEDLYRLLRQPDRAVVRAAPADLGRLTGVRRLLHPDGGDPATLIEVPRRWLALDIDSLALPAFIAAEDIFACAKVATAELPSEFRGVRCIAQATASHGFKPGIRLRLWYWLDRPVCRAELRRWLFSSPVDHALFGAAQIIYTAAPIFDDRLDPLPNRMVRLPGSAQVAVPELAAPASRPIEKPARPGVGLSRYAEAALTGACRRIVDARDGERDNAIVCESYGIGRLAGAGEIPPTFAVRVLHHATSKIPGYSRRNADKVTRSFGAGLRNPRGVLHG